MPEVDRLSPGPCEEADALSSILHPLNEFYERSGLTPPRVRPLPGQAVPEPYRSLLVHRHDMTSTLERHYRRTLQLVVLNRGRRGDCYYREVVLCLEPNRRPVEFGAIKIHLGLFTPWTRQSILRERQPLGRILRDEAVLYTSRPKAFFAIVPDGFMSRVLQVPDARPLYGRRNTLYDLAAQPLAEVVEILPPDHAVASRGHAP